MPTTSPLVVIDEQAATSSQNFFTFLNGWFSTNETHPFYNQTITYNSDTDFNSEAAFNLSFFGTGATVMGFTSCSFSDQCHIKFSLDDGDKKSMNTTDFDPERIILDIQDLPEGSHSLHVDASDSGLLMVVDYASITPGPSTKVSEEIFYVNCSDQAVQYPAGDWLLKGSGATDSTMETVTRGSAVEFSFAGSNLTAFSVFNQTAGGNITLTVTVDGQLPQDITISQTITRDATALGGYDDRVELYHPLFNFPFEDDAGNHTVSIHLVSLSEFQVFDFRSFSYKPNFEFLNSETSIVPEKVTASGTSGTGPGGSGNNNSGNNGESDKAKQLSAGGIAGAVIGSVLLVSILITVGILLVRRKKMAKQRALLSPVIPSPFTINYPDSSVGSTVHISPQTTYPSKGNHTSFTNSNRSHEQSPVVPSRQEPQVGMSELTMPGSEPGSDGNGLLTQRRIVEMIERLNNRVEELHRPPGYSTNHSS
ncbi:hypothetical protein VKT23_006266 [Stygiomarasmius scandens]|uniref:Uncharacterized protein n=1 Tax=Marasmiellus scandens TaxID=2682957 RepID=A0ABR1JMY6_9AGAR